MNLDDNQIIQDMQIQDQPIGYNFNAPLPTGVANIRTRLFWGPPEPALIRQDDQRPRPRRVALRSSMTIVSNVA
eukprot:3410693-Pyramimonas_sp.AAC.1